MAARVTGEHSAAKSVRELTAVLFVDIVEATPLAVSLGDRAWAQLLERYHEVARRAVARHGGWLMDTAGDGFFAMFDGPARAVRCAMAAGDAVRELGMEIRAGLHTGEVELSGSKVSGLAVHIGSRIGALAGRGEVLVSATVKDLMVGSGIEFEARGDHELKGVPGTWSLFAVREA